MFVKVFLTPPHKLDTIPVTLFLMELHTLIALFLTLPKIFETPFLKELKVFRTPFHKDLA